MAFNVLSVPIRIFMVSTMCFLPITHALGDVSKVVETVFSKDTEKSDAASKEFTRQWLCRRGK